MASDELINLALRRSIFYPSAEIYSSAPSGFFDFGPIGERIRRRVVDFWRKELVQKENMLEVCGAQILPQDVFKASGHLQSFNDPITQCTKCHAFFRADSLIKEKADKLVPESLPVDEIDRILRQHNLKCQKCGSELGKVKQFNMMMKLDIGATGDAVCYLRPETCQTIFLNFPRLYRTMRQSLPLAIAQAGAAFRNEIAPRNALLREREIGQMEVEVFFNPYKINSVENFKDIQNYKLNLQLLKGGGKINPITCRDAVAKKIVSGELVAYYLARIQQLYESYGIKKELMRFRELEAEERAFYAKETWDFEVLTEDYGWVELVACNYRTDFDLSGHQKVSGQKLSVKEDGKEFVPHVFELSAGIDRTLFVLLDIAFSKKKRGPEERIYLSLNPRIAPYTVSVLPLVNKDGIDRIAEKIFDELNSHGIDAFYDKGGSIGRRYARADEIGIPYGITVDYDSKKKKSVTLRERDSMKQKRVRIKELPELMWKLQIGKATFKKLK